MYLQLKQIELMVHIMNRFVHDTEQKDKIILMTKTPVLAELDIIGLKAISGVK